MSINQGSEGRVFPLNKYVYYLAIDHPDAETVVKIIAEYNRKNKKNREQVERNKINDKILRECKLGKYKNK